VLKSFLHKIGGRLLLLCIAAPAGSPDPAAWRRDLAIPPEQNGGQSESVASQEPDHLSQPDREKVQETFDQMLSQSGLRYVGMIAVPHIHFVGIGGIGMSGLARVLLEAGYPVSGCDRQLNPITERLSAMGATIHQGHSRDHVAGVDLLVISSAIPADNPDLMAARQRELPIVKRAELLGHLMKGQRGVTVAGTHGKTTTTGMIAWILEQAGMDPTIFAGGELINLDTNAKRGNGPYVVAEADEYDHAFLQLTPELAVVTNIEADHPDIFESVDAIVEAFGRFLDRVVDGGRIVACADDPRVRRLVQGRAGVTTYGLQSPATWWVTALAENERGGHDFRVRHKDTLVGEFTVQLPGVHNVSNALAAIAATSLLGVEVEQIRQGLATFRGTKRRFEVKGVVQEVTVVDDYAHHPTEIRATLAAARQRFRGREIWAVFQPHTYSRTVALLEDFAAAFEDADHVVVTAIYAARERDTLGVRSEDLVTRMQHPDARHIPKLEEAAAYLAAVVKPGDVVFTLGAGDVWKVGEWLLERLSHSALPKRGTHDWDETDYPTGSC